jgi:phosphate transport system permease protein
MSSPLSSTTGILNRRRRADHVFRTLCTATAWTSVLALSLLLLDIVRSGSGWVDLQFLQSFSSRFAHKAGVYAALSGSLWLAGLTALFSIPVGVAAAVYLEEYAPKNRLSRLIEVNIANLAGVPSIVYGMLGLAIFVRALSFGHSILAGAATLSLLILPVNIITSREAIRAVPQSLRHGSYALGATRWQTIRAHVLPVATPGIVTGVILSLSRAIGETAPLIIVGASTYVAFLPEGPLDNFTSLPIQIFNWSARPQPEFHELAAAGIIVLLVVLFVMNGTAAIIRFRSQRNRPW